VEGRRRAAGWAGLRALGLEACRGGVGLPHAPFLMGLQTAE
jgi:hypothetical protein